MTDLEDVKLDKAIDEAPARRASQWRLWWLAIASALLVVALAVGYLALRQAERRELGVADAEPPSQAPSAAAERQPEPGDDVQLPPLDQTDALVRELVRRLSLHPRVTAWLATDGLILNFALVTLRISQGETPVAELGALAPGSRFRVRSSKGILYLDPLSYQRYDGHAGAVAALDARGTARLYATLKPRILDAYGRLGEPAGDFDLVLEQAIVELLEVPLVEGDVRLTPKTISYAFADLRLEALSAAQKQFLRMGPRSVRLLQAKLREIAYFLGIPDSRLPD